MATQLPPLEQIMYEQNAVSKGFIRTQILPHLTSTISKLMTVDVIDLCNKYYIVDIIEMKNKIPIEMNPDHLEWFNEYADAEQKELYEIDVISGNLLSNKDYYIAFQLFTLLIDTNEASPSTADFHHSLAVVSECWNLKEKAIEEYKLAIELDPDNDNIRYDFGLFLQSKEQYQLSLEQFIKASEIDPDYPEYAMEVGYTYGALMQSENAKKYFLKAIEMRPESAPFHAEYAYFLSEIMADLETAKIEFEKAIELDDKYASAWFDYARMLRDYVRDYKKAEEYYLKAVELNPDANAINGSYGYLLHLMGDNERAKEYIERQKNLDDKQESKNNWTYFYYGLINRDKEDVSLSKALEFTESKLECEKVLFRLSRIKVGDISHADYYEKFEKLLYDLTERFQ